MKLPRFKVIKFLREEVKKPELPLEAKGFSVSARFKGARDWYCPVGLHQKCVNEMLGVPAANEAHSLFPEIREKQFLNFMAWWDRLTIDEAKEAVELIWPN